MIHPSPAPEIRQCQECGMRSWQAHHGTRHFQHCSHYGDTDWPGLLEVPQPVTRAADTRNALRLCPVCGTQPVTDARAQYCSVKCKQQAYRERQRVTES